MPSYIQNADLTIFCNVEKDGVIALFTYNLLLNILKFPFQADFFLRSFNKNQTKFSVCHGHTNF